MSRFLNKKILLVDDELIIGMATKQKLEKMGYSVLVSPNRELTLKIIDENSEVELVLMDIDLGRGSNGIDLCKELLSRKKLPVVFVSSHTEPEIVSLTEQVTSYGYIVKSSSITVYDASIKMAFKLFYERYDKEVFSMYLNTALNNADEPIFISNMNKDIVFYNKAYLKLQGSNEHGKINSVFEEYSKLICVFSAEGEMLETSDWASIMGLNGKSGENVAFYIFNKVSNKILANIISYAPIYDETNKIIGSYVKITGSIEKPDSKVLERIHKNFNLTTGST